MKIIMLLIALSVMLAAAIHAGAQNDGAMRATAILKDMGGKEVGIAYFTEDSGGIVHIDVIAKGLPPGQHGIHIHKTGSCSPTFAAAGEHYNPGGKRHGLDNPDGPHAGDLPDMVVDENGAGNYAAATGRITLSPGPATVFDSDGSAIVIHAGPDDQVTDPSGNSGDRIACGVIEIK